MDFELLCNKVLPIIRHTGNFIRKESLSFQPDSIETKGLNDFVSYVDKNAEQLLVSNLKNVLPGAGFITEEEVTENETDKEFVWIIDPLDGTSNFIHGIPTYAISVALYQNQKPVLGVVYEINRGEMFYSYLGAPLMLNNKVVKVSSTPKLADSLVATGFPYYQFDQLTQYINLFTDMLQNCRGVRRIGSAAVDLAYVACGRFDAYFEYNLNSYDVAAGAFLVQQAGGQVFNFSGGDEFIHQREIVACNGLFSQELVSIIGKHFH
jgi:myo-inositol-1(or 4)-monophosphatase